MTNLDRYPGTPRWVRAFGLITLGLALVFVLLHLTGRGFGDHGHHASSGARAPSLEGGRR
jgi:hypothetical protein